MAYFLNGIGSSAAVLFGALVQYVLASAFLLRPFAASWQARNGRAQNGDDPSGLLTPGSGAPSQVTRP